MKLRRGSSKASELSKASGASESSELKEEEGSEERRMRDVKAGIRDRKRILRDVLPTFNYAYSVNDSQVNPGWASSLMNQMRQSLDSYYATD